MMLHKKQIRRRCFRKLSPRRFELRTHCKARPQEQTYKPSHYPEQRPYFARAGTCADLCAPVLLQHLRQIPTLPAFLPWRHIHHMSDTSSAVPFGFRFFVSSGFSGSAFLRRKPKMSVFGLISGTSGSISPTLRILGRRLVQINALYLVVVDICKTVRAIEEHPSV